MFFFSAAKGKAGQEALKMVKGMEDHLNVILLTVPFFYSNFLAFFAPLPNDGRTQWELSACFGDGSTKIDMMSAGDLSTIVRKFFKIVKTWIYLFCCCLGRVICKTIFLESESN